MVSQMIVAMCCVDIECDPGEKLMQVPVDSCRFPVRSNELRDFQITGITLSIWCSIAMHRVPWDDGSVLLQEGLPSAVSAVGPAGRDMSP